MRLKILKYREFNSLMDVCCEPGSSVSIVSDYGLDDRAIEFRSSAEAKRFLLWPVCPERLCGPPSLLCNGYRGFFPGGKARPGVTLTTQPI
jgi:hypothetical protein